MGLRPYQVACVDACRQQVRTGHKRVLLVLVTGGGKTITSASVVASALGKGKRCLFVAHRLELIEQSVQTFYRLGCRDLGVIRGGDIRIDPSQPLQVASIQTLARRSKPPADLIVIDEAHRASAASYRKHLFDAYPDATFLGLTATPCRADGKPLGVDWHTMVVGARYSELLTGGHIVAPDVYSTPVLPDLSTVRTSGGDFNQEDLEAAVNRGAQIGDLVANWLKHSQRQRTVAFAVSVKHSQAIVDAFRSQGVKAEHLDGTTPEVDRRRILDRLESGETELVSNVGVLCEGWDQPSCKCLIVARPTKSLGLWMQMSGRILRPWQDVTPVILDHGGNVDRHGLPHQDREWELSTKQKKGGTAPIRMCPACFAYLPPACNPCPHCGHEFPSASSDVIHAPEEVVPVDLALRTLQGPDAQLSFFRKLAATARERGWKRGAVWHRYRERFGAEPPIEWIAALGIDYRNDPEWKNRIKARVRQQGLDAAREAASE